MTYILENDEAINLVLFKLEAIQDAITSILNMWNENNVDDFLEKTKDGHLNDAVMDAISMRQLILDQDKYQNMLNKLKED